MRSRLKGAGRKHINKQRQKARAILRRLPKLAPLDLSTCRDVNDIVAAMERCAFGARMLGRAANTLTKWFSARRRPVLVCTEDPSSPVGKLAKEFRHRGWVSDVLTTVDYASSRPCGGNVLVVGLFEPWFQPIIDKKPDCALFINPFELTRTGQIQDGYFPYYVSTPVDFALPLLAEVVEARLSSRRAKTVNEFLAAARRFGPHAKEVHQGARVIARMVKAKRRGQCTVFLTLAGAMTPAQMGFVIEDLILGRYVDHITSTGALMAHGLIQGTGLKHFAHDPQVSDAELADAGLNRITDLLEPETNFSHIERIINEVLESLTPGAVISTAEFHRLIGAHLAEHHHGTRAILKSAYQFRIPIVTPAFVDSELGNDLICHNLRRKDRGEEPIIINPELDSLESVRMMSEAETTGIISIGGGTPRNNRQNDCPLIEIINERLGRRYQVRMFSYGVRIDPARMTLGNLGGCRYSENMSWRKFRPNAKTAEILMDATVVLPLLVKVLMEQEDLQA